MQITQSDGLVWRDLTVVRIKCGDRADKAPRGCPFVPPSPRPFTRFLCRPTAVHPRCHPRTLSRDASRADLARAGLRPLTPVARAGHAPVAAAVAASVYDYSSADDAGDGCASRPPGSVARAVATARPGRWRELRRPPARIAVESCANRTPGSLVRYAPTSRLHRARGVAKLGAR